MNASENKQLDEVMCPCSGTKRSAIKRMFEQGLTVDEISQRSGALSGCGGCEWEIAEFLKELTELKVANKNE